MIAGLALNATADFNLKANSNNSYTFISDTGSVCAGFCVYNTPKGSCSIDWLFFPSTPDVMGFGHSSACPEIGIRVDWAYNESSRTLTGTFLGWRRRVSHIQFI
jgi:hypothetical protein